MQTNYVLIDYENVHVRSLDLLKGDHFQVHVFLGPKNMKLHRDLVFAMQTFGERGKYITLEAHGKNALDFHIAYYLGVLASDDPAGFFHVISRDTGFDPLLHHLKERGILCGRSDSIEAMPCFRRPSTEKPEAKQVPNETKGVRPAGDASVEELAELMVKDLVKRKAARPRTLRKLRGTIQARCGKNLPAPTIDAVIEKLEERGYVSVDGEVEPLAADKDVFGDGTAVILNAPGHTPGHHSLLVKLKEKGNVLLTGDAAHFHENYETSGVPIFNTSRAETLASLDRLKKLEATLHATVIIQHDARDVGKLPTFPAAAR